MITLMLLWKYQISKFSTTFLKYLCFAGSPGMTSAPLGCVGMSDDHSWTPCPHAPGCWHWCPHPSFFFHSSGRCQTHQPCHARVVEKGYLPVLWRRLWGAKPGDAFHLLGDHILGEVIVPGQSCQGTGQGEIGSGQPEGPGTGTSGDQNCNPCPAVYWVWKSKRTVEGVQRPGGWSEVSFSHPQQQILELDYLQSDWVWILCHLLIVWPWAICWTCLSLDSLICKMGAYASCLLRLSW